MASLPYPLNWLYNHGRVGMASLPYPPTDCRSYIKINMNTYLTSDLPINNKYLSMNKSTISKQRSYLTDLYSTLAAKSHRRSTLWLMLLMLLFAPTSMVAQTDPDNTVTFTALEGNPVGYKGETYANLFDGKKEIGNFSKWCGKFYSNAYVIFEASKAGVPVGYTITTCNDNESETGRNPKSWKL